MAGGTHLNAVRRMLVMMFPSVAFAGARSKGGDSNRCHAVLSFEKPLRASLIEMFEAAGPADAVRGLRALGQLFVRDNDFGAFVDAHEIDGDQRVAQFGARRSPGEYQTLRPIYLPI